MSINNIGITLRIPLNILESGIHSFLDGSYSREYLSEQLSLEFDGANRVRKTLIMAHKIIANNPLQEFIIRNKAYLENALKIPADRNVILISLVNGSYPFSFSALRTLGKLFSAQDYVSRDAFVREMTKHYGGNRTTSNATDSVIPMLLEAGFIIRPKQSLYSWQAPILVSTSIAHEIYKESFNINQSSSQISDFHLLDPYFIFVKKG